VGGTYRCEATDGSRQVMASADIEIQTKPIITTGLPTAEVKKSSGECREEIGMLCRQCSTGIPDTALANSFSKSRPRLAGPNPGPGFLGKFCRIFSQFFYFL
jgi:hypothetical protein